MQLGRGGVALLGALAAAPLVVAVAVLEAWVGRAELVPAVPEVSLSELSTRGPSRQAPTRLRGRAIRGVTVEPRVTAELGTRGRRGSRTSCTK